MPPDFAPNSTVDHDTVKMLLSGVLLPCEAGDEVAGDELGAGLRLLERLGEGGFGVVWRAEQTEPVRREVAVKLIKLGMDSREVIGRFEQERQVLAAMEHPCITKVFDAGLTPDGRPYFVMELVRGLPLNQHAKRKRLPLETRLELFIELCHGVHHAHQKGIIHRDLKPSNVLVAEMNERTMPKIIDFGIAKALTTKKLASVTLATRPGMAMGSPLYMAPEQAAGVEVVDTRCDVYALGAMLYELLTDTPPFPAETLTAKGEEEMRRIIREVMPSRPSRRASGQKLPADLDWITLRALEKEPARRYGSAEELAQDLQRFLASEPVRARPPEWSYLTGLWVRRHRAACVAVLASAAALILGAFVAWWQAAEAKRQRDTAVQQTALAMAAQEAAKVAKIRAEQTSAFLSGLLDEAAAEVEAGSNPAALSKALARSQEALMKLSGDPELQGNLLDRMARLHGSIGEWDNVIACSAALEEVMASMHGPESEEAHNARLETLKWVADHGERLRVPAALDALRVRVEKAGLEGKRAWFAVLREQVRVWIKLDDRVKALKAGEELMAAVQRWQVRGQGRLNARLAHAAALEFAGRYDEALALLEQCRIAGVEEKAKEKSMLAIESRQLMILEARGDSAGGADVLMRRVVQMRAHEEPGKVEDLIKVLLRLAGFESAAGRHEEALQHADEALRLARHPEDGQLVSVGMIGRCLNCLAACGSAAGRHEQAVSHARESRAMALKTGKRNDLVFALEQLAWSQWAARQLEAAFGTWQELVLLQEDDPNFKSVFYAMEEMAVIRHEQTRHAEALEIIREVWRRCVSHPAGARDIGELGSIANLGLRCWAAQEKAFPGTPPPAELAAWRRAVEVDRSQNTAKGRAAPDKGPSARPERVRKSEG